MKKNRLFTTICLMAAILFTACTQDELSSPTGGVEGALPDGEYPLQTFADRSCQHHRGGERRAVDARDREARRQRQRIPGR